MGFRDVEELRVYRRAEGVADDVWNLVIRWDRFAKDVLGKQLCRSADSIGANIAESAGRYHAGEVVRFLYYARGSIRETRYWLKRALKRSLITDEVYQQQNDTLDILTKELNAYINFQKRRRVKESGPDCILESDNQPYDYTDDTNNA